MCVCVFACIVCIVLYGCVVLCCVVLCNMSGYEEKEGNVTVSR